MPVVDIAVHRQRKAAHRVADARDLIAFARAGELGDRWAELHKPASRGRLEIVRSQPGRPVAS